MVINGMRVPDILFPTGDGLNRDEVFLIDFDDILQCECENIYYGLLQIPELLKVFPGMEKYKKCKDSVELYYDLAPYDKYTFLQSIADNELDKSFMDEVVFQTSEIDTYNQQHLPNMMFAMSEVAAASYCKEVIIYFKRQFFLHDMEYITANFGSASSKVSISDDSLLYLMKEDKERHKITTVMTADLDAILKMFQEPETYNLHKTAFVLRNSSLNVKMTFNQETGKYNTEEFGTEEIALHHLDCQFTFGRYAPEPFLRLPNIVGLGVNLPLEDDTK